MNEFDLKPRYPDFLCIGAQKAGTTWIYHNLWSHPQIGLSDIKETFYLNFLFGGYIESIPDYNWVIPFLRKEMEEYISKTKHVIKENRKLPLYYDLLLSKLGSKDWYPLLFSVFPKNKLCGEICPDYSILSDDGIRYICENSPNLKVFIVCRDPVERDISYLKMEAEKNKNYSEDFFIKEINNPYTYLRSDYLTIISRWKKFVRDDNFKILFYDHLKKMV